jgi:hypothetical protein
MMSQAEADMHKDILEVVGIKLNNFGRSQAAGHK